MTDLRAHFERLRLLCDVVKRREKVCEGVHLNVGLKKLIECDMWCTDQVQCG